MVMHAYRTKTGFFSKFERKIEGQHWEAKKQRHKGKFNKIFSLCVLYKYVSLYYQCQGKSRSCLSFERFSQRRIWVVCVCGSWICWVWWIKKKKTTNLNDNLMLPEMRIHIYAMNKHSFFPKSCMFFDVSICVWQNKRVYFVIPGCVEFVIYTRSIWVGCYSLQLACLFICVCLIPIECLKLYPQYPLPSQEFHNAKHSTKLFEHM